MKMLNKSKLYLVVLISVFLSNVSVGFAQGGPDPPPGYESDGPAPPPPYVPTEPDGPEPPPPYEEDGPEPPPPSAPINKLIPVLFVLGVYYAGRKFYLNQINSK